MRRDPYLMESPRSRGNQRADLSPCPLHPSLAGRRRVYQPISTLAYALPAGLQTSHSRTTHLSTFYFGQRSISQAYPADHTSGLPFMEAC